MKLEFIEATTIPDSWFQSISRILNNGRIYTIDRGSYAGQQRLEFDHITIRIKYPNSMPLLPECPPGCGVPNPASNDYLEDYLPYLFTSCRKPNEEYCYSDDTEVLTDHGWKLFNDLDKTELVATLNPQSNFIEYQRPIGYNAFKYNGEVYECNTRRIDFCVNSGHKLFVGYGNSYYKCQNSEFNLDLVDNMFNYKFLKFKRTAQWKGNDIDTFVLPGISYDNYRYSGYGEPIDIPMDKWLKFFGIWLAEGDIARQKNKNSYQVRVSLSDTFTRSIAEKWCADLGLGVINYKRWLIISNKQLYMYLDRFGKSHNKFIPTFVKNLNSDYLKILFGSMMMGDGDKRGTRYTTASDKLADDFSELCLKIGKSAIKKFDDAQSSSGFKNNGVYRIYIADKYAEPVVENNIKKRMYNGYMYCVEVPNHHILYVRRNGKAHWSGNTYGSYLEKQIEQVIKIFSDGDHGTNQACMTVGDAESIILADPPCLKIIDCRVIDGKLNFIIYFRSNDLWNGYPVNIASLQLLKEYIADSSGLEDGELIYNSKGLHLYDHVWDIAKDVVGGVNNI